MVRSRIFGLKEEGLDFFAFCINPTSNSKKKPRKSSHQARFVLCWNQFFSTFSKKGLNNNEMCCKDPEFHGIKITYLYVKTEKPFLFITSSLLFSKINSIRTDQSDTYLGLMLILPWLLPVKIFVQRSRQKKWLFWVGVREAQIRFSVN